MPEHQGLRGDGTHTAWSEKLRAGDQEMNSKQKKIAHDADGITTVIVRKTARQRRIASYCEFATHRYTFACTPFSSCPGAAPVWGRARQYDRRAVPGGSVDALSQRRPQRLTYFIFPFVKRPPGNCRDFLQNDGVFRLKYFDLEVIVRIFSALHGVARNLLL